MKEWVLASEVVDAQDAYDKIFFRDASVPSLANQEQHELRESHLFDVEGRAHDVPFLVETCSAVHHSLSDSSATCSAAVDRLAMIWGDDAVHFHRD